MGFPVQISAPQKVTLRTSGYWQRTYCAFNPGNVVFQAESAEDITDNPFLTFAWTNTLQGDFQDVWEGMVCYISSSAVDFDKTFKYRGRVRLVPSGTEFYIDLNATTLETGDVITVVRDVDLFARVRDDTLVDGSIPWHDLPPVTTGLPSVIVLYDSDNDGTVSYTPNQTGIAVAAGAAIDEYEWAISGTGSSSISDIGAQNPDLTFAAGNHYLLRLITVDDNGVRNYLIVQVYAINRTFAAPVVLPAAAGSVNQDLDNGYTGTITAYGGVTNLPYRTHAVVFCLERFGDNSSTPIVSNILMWGRLRSESILSEGDQQAGVVQQVSYPIEGITSYMQRLKMPDDIVRATATPDEWGEMENPTPFRMAVYALYAYTTLLNLVSFSAGDALFDDWQIGGEPVSIDGGNALDVLINIFDRIKAAANYAPDGEIRSEINASYTEDRSGLVTVMDFLPVDTRAITLDIDTSRNVGQVVAFGGAWDTPTDDFNLYTAQSPSIPYSEAPEVREITRELLRTDATLSEATAEIGLRAGNDFAFNNPKWLLKLTLVDSQRWLVATNYQRYTLTYTDSIREIALTTANKFQCQGVAIAINPDGTYDVNAELYQETEFTDAQSIASQLPDNIENAQPVLPVLSNYPAFPTDPLENYPTTTPTDDELQPINPYSGWMGYSPFPPDQAADAANQQGNARCRSWQVLARNPGTTNSPFLTVNTAPYTVKISGSAVINSGWIQSNNFVAGQQDWQPYPGGGGLDASVYTLGSGWGAAVAQPGRGHFVYEFGSPTFITSVTITRDEILSGDVAELAVGNWDGATISDSASQVQTALTTVFPVEDTWDGIAIQQVMSANAGTPALNGYAQNVTVRGTGTNPFTGEPGDDITGDWFYQIQGDNVQLWGATEGGLLDGSKPAIIPDYAEDHVYSIPFTGTGNAIQSAYALSDYTGVQNKAFTLQACRNP